MKKKDGFKGERSIQLPKRILEKISKRDIYKSLFITFIGYYPKAEFHYRERKNGASESILIYCVDGNGWIKINNKIIKIKPNEFIAIPKGIPHSYGCNEKEPWTIYWLHFNGSNSEPIAFALFEKMLNHENLILFSEKRIKIFEELYNNLELGYSKSTTGYTSMLVWHFLGSFLYDDRFSASMRKTEKDSVEKSIEFMKTHIYIKLSLKEICTHVCKSTSYFSLLFKSKTGYSPIEYFNHLKIQRSCQYLQFTTLRINEIASKLGIEDPYYFSKLFTELMGSSPRRYRKTFMK